MINLEFYKKEIQRNYIVAKNVYSDFGTDTHIGYALRETCRQYSVLDGTVDDLLDWLCEKYEEPTLDNVEKTYLKDVIRPFRENVENIVKWESNNDLQYLTVNLNSGIIRFPMFKKDTMYKNMEPNKKYTLEELDL